jgi:hypothetical protein
MDKNKAVIYRPSWVDKLSAWIEGLPGHQSFYFIIIGIILLAIQTGFYWFENPTATGKFLPGHLFLSAAITFILAVIPIFDKQAEEALVKFLPLSNLENEQKNEIEQRLTNLPGFGAVIAGVLAIGYILVIETISSGVYQIEILNGLPTSQLVLRVVYLICWWCFGTFIYHTVHQLSVINQIYTRHTRINLFRKKPLYGFSSLAALTAGSIIVLPYGFFLVNSEVMTLSDPYVLPFYLLVTAVALITFLLPQLGIHRLQQDEKDRLLDETYQRYDSLRSDLHAAMDGKDYSDLSTLNTAIGMVENEINTIKGISTWPWQPETVRWLFTALVLPLLMWLLQFILGKVLI